MVHVTKRNGVIGQEAMHDLGTERSRPESALRLFERALHEGFSIVTIPGEDDMERQGKPVAVVLERRNENMKIRISQTFEGSPLDMATIVAVARQQLSPVRA